MQGDRPETTNQKLNKKLAILNQIKLLSKSAQNMIFDPAAPAAHESL